VPDNVGMAASTGDMRALTRSRSRSALIVVFMFALCAASAAATTYFARARDAAASTPAAVALDASSFASPVNPVVVAAPPAPVPPVATPWPALTVSTGSCLDVPILVYHYIRIADNPKDPLGWSLSVTPREFQAQMDWLHAAGGHPVTMEQLMVALNGGAALPSHPVVLTFDDGHDDFATAAAPILARNGFVGINYVVTGFIGRSAYMTASQVQSVAAMGMVIGAHTVDHVNLVAMSAQLATTEIEASKAGLEHLVGHAVLDFAYPYGDVNDSVASLVAQAGFRDAVTMNYGTAQCGSQRFVLHRIRVVGSDSVWSFAGKAGVESPPSNWSDPQLAGYSSQSPRGHTS
jgi:peptidoglycan/xylan/chitin deacetylase (PgdA/CDA1 family)